ncbi:unnamed protein product (macronuclear) [Paramecium tetraurelia]|uniref:Uncharacterized protein n=1 Tax=Paramecium tetraurelia TaxID=5888 RepID=A0C4R6_PARTE|nr:uncharacterized protein GSPATT00006282001 [Paramecium tetraurelia]CAK65783.1 unnamed protein product [Paramecium tetraurelia]|eukprot:XP_001433180.1 hypothetical protein (macronuclear) [Paramecium tetraurelia strain d4-2]
MLFGLVTSKQTHYFDPKTNDRHDDLAFDLAKYNNAKIIVAYPFLLNQIKQKIGEQLQIQLFNLSDILQARNENYLLRMISDKKKFSQKENQIIKLRRFISKTNEGVEIISNKEFE